MMISLTSILKIKPQVEELQKNELDFICEIESIESQRDFVNLMAALDPIRDYIIKKECSNDCINVLTKQNK